jgi:nucleotide-binding universal stress UspA family protein
VGPIVVAVGSAGLNERMVEMVARLAGTGDRQEAVVTVVHVARVWGTALGIQHPALQPSTGERSAAQDVVVRAALQLRVRGVEAEAVVTSGRDTGKALVATARRAGASAIVVGRSSTGRLSRLLRGPDPARTVLDRASCTLIVVGG